jgi:UDP-N-acetylglucosamine--N-acetylmuramyl-(pentapeptide) pyrophosphoryl-undecaprenol N-acetylglucosamine transferase
MRTRRRPVTSSILIPLARDPQRLAAIGAAAATCGRRDGDEALLDFVSVGR